MKNKSGFTIVELLIVIVVIAILAAISIVAYNGIQQRSHNSSAQASARQAATLIATYHIENGSYPDELSDVRIASSSGTDYSYQNHGDGFCVAATVRNVSFRAGSGNLTPIPGDCSSISIEVYSRANSSVLATYFDRTSGVLARGSLSPPINYSWGTGSPIPGAPSDYFIAVMSGYLTPPVSGTYTFQLQTDDRGSLYINDELLIDGRDASGSGVGVVGTIALEAGKRVRYRYEAAEHAGNAFARMYWSYPGQAMVIIPASAFSG